MAPRPVLAALFACVICVPAQSESDAPVQTQRDSEAELTRLLLTRLAEGQLANEKGLSDLSAYMKEAFATLEQEVRRTQVLGLQCLEISDHVRSSPQQETQQVQVLGQPCRGDSDCSDLRAGTVCSSEGRCECGEGLQEVAGDACRPYPRLSESCRQNTDCQGATEHAVCADNVCVCGNGYVNNNDTVCLRPLLSEPCSAGWHCRQRTRHSTCRNNTCVCEDRYWNDQDAVCRPYPNIRDSCNTTSQCQGRSGNNSTCENGVCACVDGYLPRWRLYNADKDITFDGCGKVVPYEGNCSHHADCGTTAEMVLSKTARAFCIRNRCVCGIGRIVIIDDILMTVRLHGDSGCEGGYVIDSESGKLLCDTEWTEADADVLCRSLRFSGGRPGQPGEAPPLEDHRCIGYRMACDGTEKLAGDCQWSIVDSEDVTAPVSVKCYAEE